MRLGATVTDGGATEFLVWAPKARTVSVVLVSPKKESMALKAILSGYWIGVLNGVGAGARYKIRLDDRVERPDPASRFQPEGVHGPSEVVDHAAFPWTDRSWTGIPIKDYIAYELHVGTFTSEGSFDAAILRLPDLKDLGITAVEIMPVAEFPGERNWGYDGVQPFAVQSSYGGPNGLKRFVQASHAAGLAVILDVVYNHFGPEGNYLNEFGPYFTSKYKTPWGSALNFDDADSDEVRRYFIENALQWFSDYHIDALRLDAIHAIWDMSATPFLEELAERVGRLSAETGWRRILIAETNQNDTRVIRPRSENGFGMDAQWHDDFHHVLHTLLTGEDQGYYQDYGRFDQAVKVISDGYVYSGEYSPYRKMRYGNSSKGRPGEQFVVFMQNHDQIGNRLDGARLSTLIPFEGLKIAAGFMMFSPYLPMLFMGEEYGERAPFYYFVHHSDPALIEAVRKGRQEEFQAFGWKAAPPDAQSLETFLASKLDWKRRTDAEGRSLLAFYKTLIRLRREIPALSSLDRRHSEVWADEANRLLFLRRGGGGSEVIVIFNFDRSDWPLPSHLIEEGAEPILDSSDERWRGPGVAAPGRIHALSLVAYRQPRSSE